MVLEFDPQARDLNYQPGDHVAILPTNRKSLVDFLLKKFPSIEDADEPVQILVMNEVQTPNGEAREPFLGQVRSGQVSPRDPLLGRHVLQGS